MANPHNLQIGQKLWYVASDRRDQYWNREVEIAQIGRKWADLLNGGRIDLETLRKDGGKYSSPGRCYLSREAWEAEQAMDTAWDSLRREFFDSWSSKRPPHVTLEMMQQVRALLSAPQEDASE